MNRPEAYAKVAESCRLYEEIGRPLPIRISERISALSRALGMTGS